MTKRLRVQPIARSAAAALLTVLGAGGPLAAQDPGPLTVTGVVVDASTGAPVVGALVSFGDRAPRGLSDADGAFRIAGVEAGRHTLQAQALGYRPAEVEVTVTDPPTPIRIELQVDPIALEGLTVSGGARVSLGGTVVDATTGAPIPWADVLLTRDTQRRDARGAADAQGVFSLDPVTSGDYFLRVERLGYEGQYIPVELAAPMEPVEVRLRPDSALMAGLAQMNAQRRTRSNATAYTTRTISEERLRFSRAPGMRHFLEYEAALGLMPCSQGMGERNDCVFSRGRAKSVRVLIDEMPTFGLDQLDAYGPHEFYAIETANCPGALVIHAYTYRFMESMARRPRLMFGMC